MPLVIYNTLTRQKEPFIPLEGKKVKFYVCGVTVYDFCHVGHARAYTAFDCIKRYLLHRGYEVKHIQNFTDIDDKIIARATRENISCETLTETYIKTYFEDMSELNIMPADRYPKATEYVTQMVQAIEKLVKNKHAYTTPSGTVYFAVKTFAEYGKLSKKILDELESGSRVEIDPHKKDPLDFALWKDSKPGEPAWESPWGMGRPGWHSECSTMSTEELGEQIDIHGGGQDLIFPHHENEICQAECASGKQFAKYWVHNGFVNINDEKMSKSLGNFFSLRDVLKLHSGEVIRFFLLKMHYRSPVNFTFDGLIEAKTALEKLHTTVINNQDDMAVDPKYASEFEGFKTRFYAAMDDDFNTAEAIGVLFDLSKFINTNHSGAIVLKELGKLLGLFFTLSKAETLDPEIQILIDQRQAAKAAKDYTLADQIRDLLLHTHQISIEDTAEGLRWKKTK